MFVVLRKELNCFEYELSKLIFITIMSDRLKGMLLSQCFGYKKVLSHCDYELLSYNTLTLGG